MFTEGECIMKNLEYTTRSGFINPEDCIDTNNEVKYPIHISPETLKKMGGYIDNLTRHTQEPSNTTDTTPSAKSAFINHHTDSDSIIVGGQDA